MTKSDEILTLIYRQTSPETALAEEKKRDLEIHLLVAFPPL
jgi:hypothetical protein